MAAPHIPNLLSSRSERGHGIGRRRGRGGFTVSGEEGAAEQTEAKDRIVQQTDQDASVSRMSAVKIGYLDDPFAKEFVPMEAPRRFPIINRGTYVRTKAIDRLVDQFLESEPAATKQVVSLGAGSDTRYFRLMRRHPRPSLVYHELDFPTNTTHKISQITKSSSLRGCVGEPLSISMDGTKLDGPNYHIHAVDLRTFYPPQPLRPPPPVLDDIDPSLPTLLISECCLIYLTPDAADAVVKYFTTDVFRASTPLGLILYEPINPFDAFGKVMVSNLAARGIVLQTLHKYCSLEVQKERLETYGFTEGREALDVDAIYEQWVDEEEKERVSSLEMLDEVEEWRLLAQHYCVAWGWRSSKADGDASEASGGWKKL